MKMNIKGSFILSLLLTIFLSLAMGQEVPPAKEIIKETVKEPVKEVDKNFPLKEGDVCLLFIRMSNWLKIVVDLLVIICLRK